MNIQSDDNAASDKRVKIIETALELFVNQGLQQTSMAQISKVSKVAVGTIYHHFESKDQLVQEIYIHIKKSFGKATLFSESERKYTFKERFWIKMKSSYEFFALHPFYFLFDEMHNHSPLISKKLREEATKYYQESYDLINEGIEKDIFSSKHIHIIGPWVYNAISTLIKIKINNEIELPEEDLKDFIIMTWIGITSLHHSSDK